VGTGILAIAARFLGALMVAFIWAWAAAAQKTEKRVALVVGNSHYASEKLKLGNPANDAQDLAQALKDIGFDVILRIDVGKGEFDHALADFARKATDADAALFYYAGHGLQYHGENYFLPVDVEVQERVDPVDVEYRAVDQEHILRAVDRVDRVRGVKIIVLDACRDNPLAHQSASRSLETPGLARIDSAERTFIAYATMHDHLANDGEGRNSPFAAALIKHVKEPGVEIDTLFKLVKEDVYNLTRQTRLPQIPETSSSLPTKFYLNPGESDSDAWNRVRESTSPAEFKEFIRKYPASPFAREAQFRIDLFDRIRRENEEARQEAERRAREADKQREAELKRLEEERLAREADKKREAELKRQEEERLAREADKKKREAELKRLEEERLAREAEKKRDAELKRLEEERLAREAEKKRDAELKRLEEELLARQADKKREAELKRQEEERLAREADKKKREAELKQLEEERVAREADMKRKQEDERKKAEREREEEQLRIAALEQQEHKKQLERERQEQARSCEADQRKLEEFAADLQAAEIEQLAKDTACRSLQPAVAAAKKKVASAMKQACGVDRKALAALKNSDIETLKAAVAAMQCEAERAYGQERIAKLEYENRRMQAICADESAKFHAIDDSTPQARDTLAGLSLSPCLPLREEVKTRDKKIESRVKAAQNQLMRLGCYAGAVTGKFDSVTAKSLGLYLTRKGSKETGDHLSDGLLSELTNQQLPLCLEPVIATPTPEPQPPTNKQAIQEGAVPAEHNLPEAEKASREEQAPPARPQRHRKHVAAHEEEPSPPPERHKPHRAAREEQQAPPRRHRVEASARPHRAAKVWQPPAFVGPSASHSSPSVIGVGN